MDFSYCPNCKRNTETVSNYAVGDAICWECGLILESTTFVDEDHQGRDRDKKWEINQIIFGHDKGKNCGEQLDVDTAVSLSFCELNMDDTATSSHSAGDDIVSGVCSRLGMNSEAISVVQEAVSISKELRIDQGNPRPVLAAIVYMIGQISDYQTSLRDISMAAEVDEETIKKSYKDIYPFASTIIPNWYANEEQKCRMQFANLEIAQSQHYDKHHTSNNMME